MDMTGKTQYEAPAIVEEYDNRNVIYKVETYLFDKFVRCPCNIIDIAVGAGRTTPPLLKKSNRYLGIDFSEPMIQRCKAKFPEVEFRCANAKTMHFVEDASFDVAVFLGNGVCHLPTESDRRECLSEIHRILKPDGILIFSVLNARHVCAWPSLGNADLARRVWRICLAIKQTCLLSWQRLLSETYRNGSGYRKYEIHGGLNLFTSTPKMVQRELFDQEFELIETVQHEYPLKTMAPFVGTYCYVAKKTG